MIGKRRRAVSKPYKFTSKKQKKKLPADLAKLPSELVTNEIGEEDKIHKNDAPHVRLGIVKAAAKKEKRVVKQNILAEAYMRTLLTGIAKSDPTRPVDQFLVDICRGWVLAKKALSADPNFAPRYLWFEKSRGWAMTLKKGEPPPDRRRPLHLRRLKLRLNMLSWPERVVDILKEAGINYGVLIDDLKRSKADAEFWKTVDRASGEKTN
jgi:hypothetical protein